jgi:hypothetical protein
LEGKGGFVPGDRVHAKVLKSDAHDLWARVQ